MIFIDHRSRGSYRYRYCGSLSDIIGERLPQCDEKGLSVRINLGAGYYDLLAPGFEYCLDAPALIPSGSTGCQASQPYMD